MITKPKRVGKPIEHKFWIDDIRHPEITKYNELAVLLIKESMYANDLTFRKKNKKAYLEMWKSYYLHLGFERDEIEGIKFYKLVANDILRERKVCVKTIDHKINSRRYNTTKFYIAKTLESFNEL